MWKTGRCIRQGLPFLPGGEKQAAEGGEARLSQAGAHSPRSRLASPLAQAMRCGGGSTASPSPSSGAKRAGRASPAPAGKGRSRSPPPSSSSSSSPLRLRLRCLPSAASPLRAPGVGEAASPRPHSTSILSTGPATAVATLAGSSSSGSKTGLSRLQACLEQEESGGEGEPEGGPSCPSSSCSRPPGGQSPARPPPPAPAIVPFASPAASEASPQPRRGNGAGSERRRPLFSPSPPTEPRQPGWRSQRPPRTGEGERSSRTQRASFAVEVGSLSRFPQE